MRMTREPSNRVCHDIALMECRWWIDHAGRHPEATFHECVQQAMLALQRAAGKRAHTRRVFAALTTAGRAHQGGVR